MRDKIPYLPTARRLAGRPASRTMSSMIERATALPPHYPSGEAPPASRRSAQTRASVFAAIVSLMRLGFGVGRRGVDVRDHPQRELAAPRARRARSWAVGIVALRRWCSCSTRRSPRASCGSTRRGRGCRGTSATRGTGAAGCTPSQVALMLLIPYFHYYWMFVANRRPVRRARSAARELPTRKPLRRTSRSPRASASS